MLLGKKRGLILLISSLVLLSCKKNNTINEVDNIELDKTDYRFVFPDTVISGKTYHGDIIYSGTLDSVNTKLATDEKTRILFYSYTSTEQINYSDDYLKEKIKLDTVGAISNDTIPFYDIKFSKLGINYIDGIIEDKVYIRQKDTSKVRIITNQIRATHKVIVVYSTVVIGA